MAPTSSTLAALKACNQLERDILEQMKEGMLSLLDGLIAEADKRDATMEELEEELDTVRALFTWNQTSATGNGKARIFSSLHSALQKVDRIMDDEIREIKNDMIDSYDRYLAATEQARAEYDRSVNDGDSSYKDVQLLQESRNLLESKSGQSQDLVVRVDEIKRKLNGLLSRSAMIPLKYWAHQRRNR
ncbi:uncharacterized protein CC84DRAFT_1239286 [Paraphaeosphaeria sporulosa]|uniref:Uncharacterized protein n=1 Tax=Paraphaeosphaeria sporulosa TaxID=1460663 RepID=A0A177CLG7_9PLEO|nr:uncharacterized protein CC84DRAFT_1239286 [Paraphaeosphaeria sporulosa]OAG08146.1 hypothetical protein CC84DRAFT_1239286 [Paraphaeosphaeria sporulosa]